MSPVNQLPAAVLGRILYYTLPRASLPVANNLLKEWYDSCWPRRFLPDRSAFLLMLYTCRVWHNAAKGTIRQHIIELRDQYTLHVRGQNFGLAITDVLATSSQGQIGEVQTRRGNSDKEGTRPGFS
jgi:hypothetical protein